MRWLSFALVAREQRKERKRASQNGSRSHGLYTLCIYLNERKKMKRGRRVSEGDLNENNNNDDIDDKSRERQSKVYTETMREKRRKKQWTWKSREWNKMKKRKATRM